MKKRRFLPVFMLAAFLSAIALTGCNPGDDATKEDVPTQAPASDPSQKDPASTDPAKQDPEQKDPIQQDPKQDDPSVSYKYYITFNANDGSEEPAEIKQGFNDNQVKIKLQKNTFTREGYKFIGWAKTKNMLYGDYSDEESSIFAESITLYAVWNQIRDFTVTYHGNDGTGTTVATQTVKNVAYGDKFNLQANTFTRDGYAFLGWATSEISKTVLYTDCAEYKVPFTSPELDLYAVWQEETSVVKIIYNINDGSENPETVIQNVDKNASIYVTLRKNIFSRDGFEFLGWSTDSSSNIKEYEDGYTLFKKPTVDVTLYAVWKDKSKYSITFHENDYSSAKLKVQTVTINENGDTTVCLEDNPFTNEGNVFLGWTDDKKSYNTIQYPDCEVIKLSGDIDLYAVWYNSKYSSCITFDANGGAGTTKVQYVYDYGSYPLRKNVFSRDENYEFVGWNTDPLANTVKYTDGAIIETDKDITLYAIWKYTGEVKITFIGNGGKTKSGESITTQNVNANTSVKLDLNPFVREYYRFIGWSEKYNDTAATYTDGQSYYPPSKDVTLYAVWKNAVKTVTFHGNGGVTTEGTDKTVQKFDESLTKVTLAENQFSREGYKFLGWSTLSTSSSAYYDDKQEIDIYLDEDLYAIWAKEKLDITYKANNGSEDEVVQQISITENKYATYSGKYIENPFTRSGYEFVGWSTDPNEKTKGEILSYEWESRTGIYQPDEEFSKSKETVYYALWVKRVGDFYLAYNTTFINSTTKYSIVAYVGNKAVLNLKDELNGEKVGFIEKKVFKDNKTLRRILIPYEMGSIGESAFDGCTNLIKAFYASNYDSSPSVNSTGNSALSSVLVTGVTYSDSDKTVKKGDELLGYFGEETSFSYELGSKGSVAAYAFSGNETLKTIEFTFNKNKTFIANTIDNCSSLTTLKFTNNSLMGGDDVTLDNNSINNCPKLIKLQLNEKEKYLKYQNSKEKSIVNCSSVEIITQ